MQTTVNLLRIDFCMQLRHSASTKSNSRRNCFKQSPCSHTQNYKLNDHVLFLNNIRVTLTTLILPINTRNQHIHTCNKIHYINSRFYPHIFKDIHSIQRRKHYSIVFHKLNIKLFSGSPTPFQRSLRLTCFAQVQFCQNAYLHTFFFIPFTFVLVLVLCLFSFCLSA